MQGSPTLDMSALYNAFSVPVTEMDCGQFCAPYNRTGKPFCCDICAAVPVAYHEEWDYLRAHTNLWHAWRGDECAGETSDPRKLRDQTPAHMCLLACLGPEHCQRDYRSFSCRQFPFFPYISSDDRFIGLAYNWDFENTCWVISNLGLVTETYRKDFIDIYDRLLFEIPDDYDSYYYLSDDMRARFMELKRRIPILHRNGGFYLLSPKSEKLTRVKPEQFRKFGPYRPGK